MRNLPPLNRDALRELVEGGSAPFKQTTRSYVLYCPVPECGRPKLYIEKSTGRSRCFRCGFGGLADYVLSQVYGASRQEMNVRLYGGQFEAAVEAGKQFTLDIGYQWWTPWQAAEREDDEWEESATPDPYPPVIRPPLTWMGLGTSASAKAVAYLESRGIPLDVAEEYGLLYDPGRHRIIFPVVVNGGLRGYQGRTIDPTIGFDPDTGKEWNIPKVKTEGKVGGKCFIFQDRLLAKRRVAALVEGPIDAIKCHATGVPTVASMGKDVSTRQLDILAESGAEVIYVGLDRDAEKEANRVAKYLMLEKGLKCFRLLPPKHRGDLGDCSFEEVVQAAITAPIMSPYWY